MLTLFSNLYTHYYIYNEYLCAINIQIYGQP